MLPAYIPNSMAAVFGGGRPIDGGRVMKDGRRILGDGKTYRGLFAGIVCGVLLGLLQTALLIPVSELLDISFPSFSGSGSSTMVVLLSLASGSLFGDMFKSFFKRRLGMQRGASLPLVDQLDFVLGAWIFTYLSCTGWFIMNFTRNVMIAVLVISPLLHLTTNVIGYLIGVKKEPW
ncbi:CDP-2,3-bis-(O-geranylgeranyl)-sn-glycerol synthase [Methanomethylovorans sp.]|uniref:CDP-2,3-bis-(O-geranylgeranyl)-sn-glycerol synthase n=1 Tax=Methanomethylovorans sp. TaxID=2758717 RepID=UPI00351CA739